MTHKEQSIIAGYKACKDATDLMLDAVKQIEKVSSSVANLVNTLEGQIELLEENEGKDEILSVTQAAEKLQMSRAGLYGLVHKESIPYLKIGGTLRFSSRDLDTWMRRKSLIAKA